MFHAGKGASKQALAMVHRGSNEWWRFFGRSLFFRLGYATSQDRISNYGNHQRSMMNLNTAAAFNCASGIAGLGMVVKNENETVLLSAMGRID